MEAGFVRVVEVGQYFMTKDTGSLRQFRSVACRECTLPRDDQSSQPKGWIQGSTRIDPHEEQASQSSVKVIAARSKAKAKPQKREPVDVPSIIPMNERKWIDNEPSEPSLAAYEVSKKVISLLRHNQTVQREEDGAIQFWRIKFHLRNQFSQVQHWSDDRWKSCLAAGGGSKRRYH